jgi:hypothetical protein
MARTREPVGKILAVGEQTLFNQLGTDGFHVCSAPIGVLALNVMSSLKRELDSHTVCSYLFLLLLLLMIWMLLWLSHDLIDSHVRPRGFLMVTLDLSFMDRLKRRLDSDNVRISRFLLVIRMQGCRACLI